jgi:hypothetical protein
MSAPITCAAAGCENPVLRRPGRRGRPPIYCSSSCRPTRTPPVLVVDVDQDEKDETEEACSGRDWVVRLRRGQHAVVVARGLGRFSAMALVTELRSLLDGHGGEDR